MMRLSKSVSLFVVRKMESLQQHNLESKYNLMLVFDAFEIVLGLQTRDC